MANNTLSQPTVTIGQKFGRLTVLEEKRRVRPATDRPKGRIVVCYVCACACGVIATRDKYNLTSGRATSCGCYKGRRVKHGMCNLPEYWIWHGMRGRCNNKNHAKYYMYGGRGIKICDRWNDFENFLADMGSRPSPDHSLDRFPNKDGDYEPSNVRWATRAEQQRNTRSNVLITFNGRTMVLSDWAKEVGINPNSLKKRLKKGMPLEQALTLGRMKKGEAAKRRVLDY